MPALATPDTITGPLTVADLDAARQRSTGRIFHLHRVTVAGRDTCDGQCETTTGCRCGFPDTMPVQPQAAEACTELGAEVESMLRHRRTRSTVSLALLLAVLGYAAHLIWPLA
jgi:hypothetical protein